MPRPPADPDPPHASRQPGYTEVTRDVRVSVRTFYLADQSEPDRSHYVWAYRVTIANEGRQAVQLLKRTWLITDALGRTQRVHGDGAFPDHPKIGRAHV